MNSLISTPPPNLPHQLHESTRRPSSHSFLSAANSNMSSRKRKIEEDTTGNDNYDDRMSASPSNSPAISTRILATPAASRSNKRARPNISGRPLTLPRLLETLDAQSLRMILQSVCEKHPEIESEVLSIAPRPSVSSALQVLKDYESRFQAAFPVGSPTSSYSYNRVKENLTHLLTALYDFTPHFLPPHETQLTTSLNFLDNATAFIHRLPDWDDPSYHHHKNFAYEEMSKAWILAIKEASKRAGGIQLHNGGWDAKLSQHNDSSAGRLGGALNELRSNLGWISSGNADGEVNEIDDFRSIREELLSGKYGTNMSVPVSSW